MKILYFIESLSGMYFVDGHTYIISDGILFNEGKIDLPFYLKGIHEVSFLGKGFISAYWLMKKKPERKVFHLGDNSTYQSAFLQDGEGDFITSISDSICKLGKMSEGNGYEITYISLSTGNRVIPKKKGVIEYADVDCLMVVGSDTLSCLNWSNELLWQHKFGETHFSYSPNHIFENINDSILINWGELSDGAGAISLINKMTGDAVWKKDFPKRIENSHLINEKIYLCVGNQMMIMNLQGGIEKEFVADVQDQQFLSFWTDEKILYVFAVLSQQILAYTMDGELIRRYQLSGHPALWHGLTIYRYEDKNYLRLPRGADYFAGVENGLLVWTPEDILADKELELEVRPAIEIATNKDEGGIQSYSLNIPCTDIHELLRHTEIEVRRLLSMRAKPYYFENKETRNKKFNGQVKLLINASIGEENRPYLDMLVKRCNYFASSSFMKSGNGKKDIEVSWEFTNKE